MKDMPRSAKEWYRRWIGAFPESQHQNDWERFYMFVSVLLTNSKKGRTRYWLADNLREDCKKLSPERIKEYCDVFEHLRDFKKVWKSQQASLLMWDEHERRMREIRKRLGIIEV